MKIYQMTILMCLFQSILFAQTGKQNDTYVWDLTEFLTISEDSFKLYLYPTYPLLYGLNKGDTILAEGTVHYESDNFIKLTSIDYEWEAKKNMTIIESVDTSLNDSIRFRFIFPFDGKYKITLYLGNDYENKYEVKDQKEIVIPMYENNTLTFSFSIRNRKAIEYSNRNYLKIIKFSCLQNIVKNNNSNSFKISIPDLSNSYFNRFWINGEYLRVSEDKSVLFWHNEKYTRLGKQ